MAPVDIERIESLGRARNTALNALADISRDLRCECLTAVRCGCAPVLIAQVAGIARTTLDSWIAEEAPDGEPHIQQFTD